MVRTDKKMNGTVRTDKKWGLCPRGIGYLRAVGEDKFGDDIEVVRTGGGCVPPEVVAFIRSRGRG
jgi:hypothetical protein